MKIRSSLVAVALTVAGGVAVADDRSPMDKDKTGSKQDKVDKSTMTGDAKSARGDAADATKPKLDTAEVMKITQNAVTHIAAAERALARGEKAAAKSALAKSKQALGRLYDTPAMLAVLNEIDEALASVSSGKQTVKALDLAPITATMRSYQEFMDPELVAGIEQAQMRAKQDDLEGTQAALRMVRDRVALDVALLPVEEAYVRVLAAQQALQSNDPKLAGRLLRKVPVVISQVQVSRPLVPIRFKLHAAAEAAEAGKWQRAQSLIREVDKDVANLESLSKDSAFKSELATFADEVEQLSAQLQGDAKPDPKKIREVAARSRTIIDDDRG